jgi:hypothetical protein
MVGRRMSRQRKTPQLHAGTAKKAPTALAQAVSITSADAVLSAK